MLEDHYNRNSGSEGFGVLVDGHAIKVTFEPCAGVDVAVLLGQLSFAVTDAELEGSHEHVARGSDLLTCPMPQSLRPRSFIS